MITEMIVNLGLKFTRKENARIKLELLKYLEFNQMKR